MSFRCNAPFLHPQLIWTTVVSDLPSRIRREVRFVNRKNRRPRTPVRFAKPPNQPRKCAAATSVVSNK